jgi:hypothetical protein
MQGVFATDSEDGAIAASAIKHDSPVDTSKEGVYKVTYNVTDSDHNYVEKAGMVAVGDYIIIPGTEYMLAGKSPIRLKLSDVATANSDLEKAASITAWKISDASAAAVTLNPAQLDNKVGTQTIRFAVQAEPGTYLDVTFLIDDDRLTVTYYANGATSGNPPATGLYSAGDSVVTSDQSSLRRTGYTFGGWSFTGNGGAAYQAGQRFNIYEDTRLYAVWNPIPVVQQPTIILQPPSVITQQPIVIQSPTSPVASTAAIREMPVPYEVQIPIGTPEEEVIPEPVVPERGITGSWSLVSLLLSIFVFAASAILAFLNLRRRDEDDEEEYLDEDQQARPAYLRALSYVTALLALVPGILFFALDDLSKSMVGVNDNTIPVAIAFSIICVLIAIYAILSTMAKRNTDDFDNEFATVGGEYLD